MHNTAPHPMLPPAAAHLEHPDGALAHRIQEQAEAHAMFHMAPVSAPAPAPPPRRQPARPRLAPCFAAHRGASAHRPRPAPPPPPPALTPASPPAPPLLCAPQGVAAEEVPSNDDFYLLPLWMVSSRDGCCCWCHGLLRLLCRCAAAAAAAALAGAPPTLPPLPAPLLMRSAAVQHADTPWLPCRPPPRPPQRLVVRSLYVGAICILAIVMPFFGDMCSLIGALTFFPLAVW